jgi:hypothetical protein
MTSKPLPPRCPSCGSGLRVVRLQCPVCEAEVSGDFDLCPACSLAGETRRVFDLFLAAHGNLRQVQRELGVSYPTARQRVEEMFRQLESRPRPPAPGEVLARLRSGEISVDEAERLLRGDAG